MDVARLDEPPTPYHLGFLLGPRINAGGRVGQSDLGVRVLTSPDYNSAKPLAEALDGYNQERKAIEANVLEQAMEQAARQTNQPMIIVSAEGWHEGVIGIVAGRIKEQYNRPAAVIAWNSEGKGKASARSVSGVDLGQAVIAARQHGLLLAGGGHKMAAGFTVAQEHFAALQAFFEENLSESVSRYLTEYASEVEGSLPPSAITTEFAALLDHAGPFGSGNPTPRFLLPNVKVISADIIGSKHLRCFIVDAEFNGRGQPHRVKAMGFGMAELPLGQALLNAQGRKLEMIGKIKREFWQGRESATLLIEDARFLG
jgi:single-stranded-DNA-specific exonuclease